MPTADLTGRIQQLLETRQQHTDALERIDETLKGIETLLGTSFIGSGRRMGRPPKSESNGSPTTPPTKKRRRGRGSFAVTADELVLAFVQAKRSPTTREINAHWKSEGRGHTADNTLVKLVKTKQLKRIPQKGRESRYEIRYEK
jgi:hypothetical protein